MKKLMAGLALAAGLMAAGTASAADYVIVSRDSAIFVAVERATVRKIGSVASARITMARAEPFQILEKSVSYFVSDEEFDCVKHLTRTVSPSLYLADGSLFMTVNEPGEWKPIIPQSQADYMLQATCDPTSQAADKIEDWATPLAMVANYRQRVAAGATD